MSHALTLCLYDLLQARAREFPDRPAIFAPNQEPLTYSRLLDRVEGIAVFERPTVEGLAENIERENEEAAQIAQLIVGLEGLSEDEVRALLEADHA